jgi:hypothetical protein
MHDEFNENSLMHDRICMADADPDAWPGMQWLAGRGQAAEAGHKVV